MAQLKLELWGVPVLGDTRVPGDWITGDRGLDILLLPLISAAFFPLLRWVLEARVYRVRGGCALNSVLEAVGWDLLQPCTP